MRYGLQTGDEARKSKKKNYDISQVGLAISH